jgi:ribosomal protein S18 acetylase RimI-like enzyme
LSTVRTATRADASLVAALAERTFRDTFAATNTPENMDLHCRNSYSEARQAEEIADPSRITFLCEEGGRPAGYAQVRFGSAPACVVGARPGEIQRIYVDRDWHGRGIAGLLMDACLAAIAARGADVVWLGVWEHNARAIAFYRKLGFVAVGAHVFPLGNDPQRDLVMVRPVAAMPVPPGGAR